MTPRIVSEVVVCWYLITLLMHVSHSEKKRISDQMSENSSIEAANNENLDNNVIVNYPVVRPSIGKWMYESDDYLNDSAIDLSASSKEDNNNNTNANNTSDDGWTRSLFIFC